MQELSVRDFYGRTIGYIQVFDDGRRVALDFYRRKLGEYSPNSNNTKDFYGRIVAKGDFTAMLIQQESK